VERIYSMWEVTVDTFKRPGIYASMLLGATVAPLTDNLATLLLVLVWAFFLGQLFVWEGRIEERKKLKASKAHLANFMAECKKSK
jgi:hypothetical protein